MTDWLPGSIILNSEFKDRVINDNLRYLLFVRNENHPKTISIDDFDQLMASGKLWGRKFDTEYDGAILDKIEDSLRD